MGGRECSSVEHPSILCAPAKSWHACGQVLRSTYVPGSPVMCCTQLRCSVFCIERTLHLWPQTRQLHARAVVAVVAHVTRGSVEYRRRDVRRTADATRRCDVDALAVPVMA
jgi:hypothetical protein